MKKNRIRTKGRVDQFIAVTQVNTQFDLFTTKDLAGQAIKVKFMMVKVKNFSNNLSSIALKKVLLYYQNLHSASFIQDDKNVN